MGIASLVLGIVSIIVGFIPFCGMIALVPAFVGLVLGIVEIVQKSKKGEPKGMGIAGTVLSSLAVLIIFLWVFVFTTSLRLYTEGGLTQLVEAINELDFENYQNYITY